MPKPKHKTKTEAKPTKPAAKSTKLIRNTKYQTMAAIIVIAIAAVLGYFLFTASHAASPFVTAEAESGTLTGTGNNAATIVPGDNTASGTSYVRFGAAPTCTSNCTTTGSGHPILGLWDQGDTSASTLGVTQQATLIFAGNGADGDEYCGYSSLPNDDKNFKTNIPIVSIGECDATEAKNIANYLVGQGATNALIRPMWEMNTTTTGANSFGWQWGESSTFTAAAYIKTWQTIYTTMKGINSGFKFIWSPNGDENVTTAGAGHNLAGRTSVDTYPGDAYVDYMGADVYDWYGGTLGGGAEILAWDTSQGHDKPFAFPEWGLNGKDDPTFINAMSTTVHNPANNVYLQSYFSYDGGINSSFADTPNYNFSQSRAAYTADFKAE